MEMTTLSRTIAAEVRAVDEGHHCFVQPDGSGRIVSETIPGKHYRVEAAATRTGAIVFTCTPQGERAFVDDHMVAISETPGACRCKHASLYARRLEREALARFDAERGWVANTERVLALTTPASVPADPFDGI